MRALLAFDKFKDALGAPEACDRAADALRARHPDWNLDLCPLADGGEGFAEILTHSAGGTLHHATVTGPLGDPVYATYGLVPVENIPAEARAQLALDDSVGDIAVIEMAQASGLALLEPAQRDPWFTTSVGTGELIRLAAEQGAKAVVLGVGGSATHDLGLGALAALGLIFRDSDGRELHPPVPAAWERIEHIRGRICPLPPIRIACDVTNPLLGPAGAAAIYAPQKGLRPEDYTTMETLSARLADLLCAYGRCPRGLRDVPGTGAAGGISFGLMAAADARLLPGFALVAAWLDLDRRMAAADLILTGEGSFDNSSLSGKGPGALAARALTLGKPVHVFAGKVTTESRPGLTLHRITPAGMQLEQALRETGDRLEAAVARSFKDA